MNTEAKENSVCPSASGAGYDELPTELIEAYQILKGETLLRPTRAHLVALWNKLVELDPKIQFEASAAVGEWRLRMECEEIGL